MWYLRDSEAGPSTKSYDSRIPNFFCMSCVSSMTAISMVEHENTHKIFADMFIEWGTPAVSRQEREDFSHPLIIPRSSDLEFYFFYLMVVSVFN